MTRPPAPGGFPAAPRAAGLPRTPLLDTHDTPVLPLTRLAAELGVPALHIKREDTNARVFSGCKARSLEFTLGAAVAESADTVLTASTIGSNHLAATALYARTLGLRVRALVLPQPHTPMVERNLRLTLAAGADLVPVEYGTSVRPAGPAVTAELRALRAYGARPFVLAFGGADPRSALAHAYAGLELAEQARRQELPLPLRVHLPAASMLTAAGIAAGLKLAGLPFRVVAVDVMGDGAVAAPGLLARARHTVRTLREAMGQPGETVHEHEVAVRDGWSGTAYGEPLPGAAEEAARLRELEGIDLDEWYTAPAFLHFRRDASARPLSGSRLFWHSGSNRRQLPDTAPGGDPEPPLPGHLAAHLR
ncbi:1-aminocyclopropane-1-carboxylate deaminase/D-cysteine desulfhydrase [Streptomyces daliensis]